ncbi:MAG: insulinase family protein, partial [Myxococcaceae bacterium]
MAKASPRSPARAVDPILHALFDVHEATLPNGLRVRLLANHQAPVVSLYTFFQVGSRNERPGITGISHLFEHMMFNGAKKYGPKMFDKTLESNGGRSNAYTS